MSENCPEWYVAMQAVALAQGWPRKQVDVLVQTARAHDPGYRSIAQAEVNHLLPKWYGKPGDAEACAAQVADAVGGREGDATYFLVASRVNCCRSMEAPALDEARVQRRFTALDQLYGSTNREQNEAAFLGASRGRHSCGSDAFRADRQRLVGRSVGIQSALRRQPDRPICGRRGAG